ncbi:MAG TPA: hypothetical protein VFE46_06160 [Pirellulales bacterium]|nr:hypothetical protein [Pirellulales bacterium]
MSTNFSGQLKARNGIHIAKLQDALTPGHCAMAHLWSCKTSKKIAKAEDWTNTKELVLVWDWMLNRGDSLPKGSKVVVAFFPDNRWYVIGTGNEVVSSSYSSGSSGSSGGGTSRSRGSSRNGASGSGSSSGSSSTSSSASSIGSFGESSASGPSPSSGSSTAGTGGSGSGTSSATSSNTSGGSSESAGGSLPGGGSAIGGSGGSHHGGGGSGGGSGLACGGCADDTLPDVMQATITFNGTGCGTCAAMNGSYDLGSSGSHSSCCDWSAGNDFAPLAFTCDAAVQVISIDAAVCHLTSEESGCDDVVFSAGYWLFVTVTMGFPFGGSVFEWTFVYAKSLGGTKPLCADFTGQTADFKYYIGSTGFCGTNYADLEGIPCRPGTSVSVTAVPGSG